MAADEQGKEELPQLLVIGGGVGGVDRPYIYNPGGVDRLGLRSPYQGEMAYVRQRRIRTSMLAGA